MARAMPKSEILKLGPEFMREMDKVPSTAASEQRLIPCDSHDQGRCQRQQDAGRHGLSCGNAWSVVPTTLSQLGHPPERGAGRFERLAGVLMAGPVGFSS